MNGRRFLHLPSDLSFTTDKKVGLQLVTSRRCKFRCCVIPVRNHQRALPKRLDAREPKMGERVRLNPRGERLQCNGGHLLRRSSQSAHSLRSRLARRKGGGVCRRSTHSVLACGPYGTLMNHVTTIDQLVTLPDTGSLLDVDRVNGCIRTRKCVISNPMTFFLSIYREMHFTLP